MLDLVIRSDRVITPSGVADLQSPRSPCLLPIFWLLFELPLPPAPNISAAARTLPSVPVSIANAPMLAPRT